METKRQQVARAIMKTRGGCKVTDWSEADRNPAVAQALVEADAAISAMAKKYQCPAAASATRTHTCADIAQTELTAETHASATRNRHIMDDEEKYNRHTWMSDDQWECAIFLRDLFRGFHHVNGEIKCLGLGIEINSRNSNWAATYDYDGLTRAVVMAHDRMIRFEIRASGPGMLRLCLWKRHARNGRMNERHPTMESAIEIIRGAISDQKKEAA